MDDDKLIEIIKQELIEALDRKGVTREMLSDAIEDIALARAVKQGETTELVSRKDIFQIIEMLGTESESRPACQVDVEPGNEDALIGGATAEAERRKHEIFTQMSGEEKVRLAMQLGGVVRDISWAGFCKRYTSVPEKIRWIMFLEDLHGIKLSKPREEVGPGAQSVTENLSRGSGDKTKE